ncbi:hypothetical protein HPB50_010704 [Hyalomma asiaticum]|uniref:Uncharacterized protein n=1 Tax=Hyalomma asiaticum TaxID=266040 RepID=A0ACB7SDK6_HYAAI|nr:hypothetical protein HPB50_010704 [Hyalomma asiaticum]
MRPPATEDHSALNDSIPAEDAPQTGRRAPAHARKTRSRDATVGVVNAGVASSPPPVRVREEEARASEGFDDSQSSARAA